MRDVRHFCYQRLKSVVWRLRLAEIAEFNDFVQQDDRVENVLLTVRDGLMMAQKKNGFQNKD
jgi:hypothetical protein